MELLLVRHALPDRVDNTPTGEVADPALSDLGLRQTAVLADWLAGSWPGGPPAEAIDAVYASPMVRALETASPVAERLGCPKVVEGGLAEYDAEEVVYIPVEELRAARDPRWFELVSDEAIPDLADFQARVVVTVEGLVAAHSGQRLVLVCHGGVIGAYLAYVLGIQRVLFFEAGYTSISRVLAASTGERSVASMNELAHLRAAGVPLYGDGS